MAARALGGRFKVFVFGVRCSVFGVPCSVFRVPCSVFRVWWGFLGFGCCGEAGIEVDELVGVFDVGGHFFEDPGLASFLGADDADAGGAVGAGDGDVGGDFAVAVVPIHGASEVPAQCDGLANGGGEFGGGLGGLEGELKGFGAAHRDEDDQKDADEQSDG
jgi:hypothetical protein